MAQPRAIPSPQRNERCTPSSRRPRHGWDPDERRAAWELDLSEPRWTVFYGPYTRRFYALAAWPAPHPLVLDASDTEELRSLISEAETMHVYERWQETTRL